MLFVTPSELSSGEAITALHMAERIEQEGGHCVWLSSPFTARFLEPRFGDRVTRLSGDADRNRALWTRALRDLRPHAIIFADYPLLFFSNGIAPLVNEDWVASLESLDALPITLDHLGYAQRAMRVNFGPPHLSLHSEVTPEIPREMRVLLPCPMNAPGLVGGRHGTPFRYLNDPFDSIGADAIDGRGAARDKTLRVVHAVPNWAWRIAQDWRLPYYNGFSQLLEYYFADLPVPVTVVSVNNGELLPPSRTAGVDVFNSGVLAPTDYERLMATADLLITDNAVSNTVGRAVCALLPVACFRNPRRLLEIIDDADAIPRDIALEMERMRLGSVFPFEVFPIWNATDVEQLGLFRDNPITRAIAPVDLFGGAQSRSQLRELVTDAAARSELRSRQREYAEQLRGLPDAYGAVSAALSGRER
jgi:hypothetical protein